jgi:uncharacterized protein (DUF885 family)
MLIPFKRLLQSLASWFTTTSADWAQTPHGKISAMLLTLGITAVATAQTPDLHLQRLIEDRFEWKLEQFPEMAMSMGDYRYANRVTDHGLDALRRRHSRNEQDLAFLLTIDRDVLPVQQQLNHRLLELLLRDAIEDYSFKMFLAPVGARSGPHQAIPQMHERVRFGSTVDYDNYLTRLQQVPRWLGQITARMKLGIAKGIVPPRVVLKGVPAQIDRLLNGGLEALAEPLGLMDHFDTPTRRRIEERFESQALPPIKDALVAFKRFMESEYLPACRDGIAATDLPRGAAYYGFRLRHFTTTDLDARTIHATGLREVKRIQDEMMTVIRASDFMARHAGAATMEPQALFKAFVQYLRSDSRFYHDHPEQLLAEYRDICKKVDAWLPKFFGRLPRQPYGVRAIPEFMAPTQTTAYYSPGDMRNAEPGYFYANTYALNQRPKYEMVALAMHEAVPGHHLQVALARELTDVPEFRRRAWFTAYGEGWALYSERLGMEMGLYDDPYDNFGRLLYEMWRACRLVVDPGMHALGWSREQAVQYMLDHTALSELNVNNEIDRYISWPGQATAYKIGELKIRELRSEAEQRLQERFDLRQFHDVVLGAGSIPLSLLEERVNDWVRRTATRGG